VFKNYIEGLPFYDDPGFIQSVNDLVEAEQIDLIFPANDSVQLELARNAGQLKCDLISSSYETCEICRSKAKTYRTLEGVVRVPRVFQPDAVEEDPVFLKPDRGQGSEGVHLANNRAELDFYLAQNPDLLILENLPGKEYTVDCFTDRHGVLRGAFPRLRARIKRGISVTTYPARDPAFLAFAKRINRKLDLRGVWFFQVKEDRHGKLTLMEVASRVAGSMGLTRNLGVNLPLLSIYDRLGLNVDFQLASHDLVMDRALGNRFKADLDYRHVYVDLDDTLIVDGKVNPMLAAFLFQCKNRDIPLYLITRNPNDVRSLLGDHGLSALFEEILQVQQGQEKAALMTYADAIFIDDSFQERVRVSKALGIPGFDLDAVESLIDHRR
jgi:FMN phosphatase YigB (HAD superfamily)